MLVTDSPYIVVLFDHAHLDALRHAAAPHTASPNEGVVLVPVRPLLLTIDASVIARQWEERLRVVELARQAWGGGWRAVWTWEVMPVAGDARRRARRIAQSRGAAVFIAGTPAGDVVVERWEPAPRKLPAQPAASRRVSAR